MFMLTGVNGSDIYCRIKTLLVHLHRFVHRVADKIRQDSLDLGDAMNHAEDIGGKRMSGVYWRLPLIPPVEPSTIFLDIGTNDLSQPERGPCCL